MAWHCRSGNDDLFDRDLPAQGATGGQFPAKALENANYELGGWMEVSLNPNILVRGVTLVTLGNTVLRANATELAPGLATMPPGARVYYLGEYVSNAGYEWIHVQSANNISGWVRAGDVKVDEAFTG